MGIMIRDSVIGRVSLVKRGPSSFVNGVNVVDIVCTCTCILGVISLPTIILLLTLK